MALVGYKNYLINRLSVIIVFNCLVCLKNFKYSGLLFLRYDFCKFRFLLESLSPLHLYGHIKVLQGLKIMFLPTVSSAHPVLGFAFLTFSKYMQWYLKGYLHIYDIIIESVVRFYFGFMGPFIRKSL